MSRAPTTKEAFAVSSSKAQGRALPVQGLLNVGGKGEKGTRTSRSQVDISVGQPADVLEVFQCLGTSCVRARQDCPLSETCEGKIQTV